MRAGGVVRVLIAGVAAVGLVYAGSRADTRIDLTRPGDSTPSSAPAVSSTLTDASVTCPGPERGGLVGSADAQAAQQKATVLSTSAPRSVFAPGVRLGPAGSTTVASLPGNSGGPSTSSPAGSTRGSVTSTEVTGDRAARLDSTQAMAPGSTAAQVTYDSIRSARGLSYLQCTGPVQNAWVLAGGNEKGRLTRLVLANPGESPVTVDVTVIGSAGRDPASVAGTVLPPGERRVLTLPALRAGTDPAIRVTTSGGRVAVAATDVWVAGESRIGEETTGVSASPDTTQMLPVVNVVSAAGPAPVVRVADPGKEDAVVRVQATGANGSIATERALAVPAGRTASVALAGLTAGSYSVQVISDVPVVAAASVRATASGTGDIAWSAGVVPVTTLTGAALPTRLTSAATLAVATTRDTAHVVISTVDEAGAVTSTTKTVTPSAPVLQPLPGAASVWVTVRSGSVRTAITVQTKDRDGPLIATTALAPLALRVDTPEITPATD